MSIERDKFIVKILNAIIYITLAITIGSSLYRYIDNAPERARIKQLETERELAVMCRIKRQADKDKSAYMDFIVKCANSVNRTHTGTDDADDIVTECRNSANTVFPEVYIATYNKNRLNDAILACERLGI